MIKLRDYQESLANSVRASFSQGHKRVLAVLPCRAGKTWLFAYVAERHLKISEDNYVWFLVHRKELVDQAKAVFENNGLDTSRVLFGMIPTLYRHIHEYRAPTLIIEDEAHHNTRAGKMWTTITDTYPNVPMVGLTATPARLDGAPLGDVFDDMCIGVGCDFLTKRGYLAPYDYYAPKSLNDYSERGNDFDMESVEMSLLKSKIMGDVMKYLDLSRKTIIYCPTLKYSRRLVEQIGPLARHVDGETPDDERKQAMDDFRSGKVRVLSNYALFGEGVDVPDCDCVIMLRPTLSVSLYIQMAMRCLTYFPNKRAVIYDFVGNAYRHGMPTEQRDWSLEGKMKCPNPSGEKEVKIRECSNCLRVYQGQDRICPYCGHDNGKTRREIEQDKKDELERITKIEKRKLRQEQGMAETMEDLIKIAKTRGYKNPRGWAWYVYNSRRK